MPADRADAAEIGVKILMVVSPSIAREADLPARAVAVSEREESPIFSEGGGSRVEVGSRCAPPAV